MNSTSPQPTSPVPSIESLAPPLPEAKAAASAGDGNTQPVAVPAAPIPIKDELWVPVEVQAEHAESGLRTDADATYKETVSKAGAVEVATEEGSDDQSPTLFNRVMKQRSGVLPQTAHVQKDNTLAIFITLCLVVVAIACGIYFIADRETQVQDQEHTVLAPSTVEGNISASPPPVTVNAPVGTGSSTAPVQSKVVPPLTPTLKPMLKEQSSAAPPNPLFGKPMSSKAAAALHVLSRQEKAAKATQESEAQLSRMQYIEAEYSAHRATELSPASATAWLALGRALYCQGRYAEAKQAFKSCINHGTHSKASKLAADFVSTMLRQTK